MKRIFVILICVIVLLVSCSCGTSQQPSEVETTNYSIETTSKINDYIESELSVYGFKYNVTVLEDDGKLNITVSLSRDPYGAEEAFSDTVIWCFPIVQKAIKEYNFNLGELEIAFVLYDGALDGETSGAIKYTTEDLKTGTLVNASSYESLSRKSNVAPEDVLDFLS